MNDLQKLSSNKDKLIQEVITYFNPDDKSKIEVAIYIVNKLSKHSDFLHL